MNRLIVLSGPPASGKTTWSKEEVEKNPNMSRVSKDDIREMLFNGEYTPEKEKIVDAVRDFAVERLLNKGHDVIVDSTNLRDKHWKRIQEIASNVGNTTVENKIFSEELPLLNERNNSREKPVPEDEMNRMWEEFKNYKTKPNFYGHPRPDINAWLNKPIYSNKKNALVCDLSGTLFLWGKESSIENYQFNIVLYSFIVGIANLLQLDLILVLAKPEKYKKQIEKLLKENNVEYKDIFLRPYNMSNEKDSEVKEYLYNTYLEPTYNIIASVDDRNQTVELWRRLGIPTLQVNPGNF